ncbi:helix-turn-helix domain-containing protein [Domibacillus indicus]|uniref:helix-turn-helix domain-containing protein n=1 Tax=Domibacillus indicus TaxID=1437523 RepID=UPI000617F06B|nr:helix-turn-helix domain-containing protein [Domibacillus indicus]
MFNSYDDLVPLEDLMEILDIGRNKAYELLQSGEIKSFKIGKAYRIPKLCIQDYVLTKVQMKIGQQE